MSTRALLTLFALAGLAVGCVTVRGAPASPPQEPAFGTQLSNDPEILLVEARAYLLAEHWADAAIRFDKLLTGLDHPPDHHLFLAGALFLARSRADRLELERAAARSLLEAWEGMPGARGEPRFDETQRLVQRAALSMHAEAAERDAEYSAGPSNAIVVHQPSEQDFFLSRTRCGPDLRGVWRRVERAPMHTYLEYYDKVTATCDGGEGTREFWIDTSVWVALHAAVTEGDAPPDGFTRAEAELLVGQEAQRAPVSAFAP